MLRNFQTFIDYNQLIKLGAQAGGYRISMKKKNNPNYKQPTLTQKKKKLRRHN